MQKDDSIFEELMPRNVVINFLSLILQLNRRSALSAPSDICLILLDLVYNKIIEIYVARLA